jgi:hypothetical protein
MCTVHIYEVILTCHGERFGTLLNCGQEPCCPQILQRKGGWWWSVWSVLTWVFSVVWTLGDAVPHESGAYTHRLSPWGAILPNTNFCAAQRSPLAMCEQGSLEMWFLYLWPRFGSLEMLHNREDVTLPSILGRGPKPTSYIWGGFMDLNMAPMRDLSFQNLLICF